MSTDTRTELPGGAPSASREARLGLVVVWSRSGARLGELVSPDEDRALFGRGTDPATQGALPYPQRPYWPAPRPADREPFEIVELSRRQLSLHRRGDVFELENLGKLPLSKGGVEVGSCIAAPGDVLFLGAQIGLLVVRRRTPMLGPEPADDHAFGAADASGIVGESPAIWQLRSDVEFLARRAGHVLVTGESGTGKELVARAIHAESSRRRRPLVSRNAATIPDSLADAELFGHAKGYPNPGMPERPGLVGEAHGSTLFLDEIGELPVGVQARLLRVMDEGESTRLGEAQPRRTDLRVVGATNRDPAELKPDLAARFLLRVETPRLDDRREDIPLLVRHMVYETMKADPGSVERFVASGGLEVDPLWLEALLAHRFTMNARELYRLTWDAITRTKGSVLGARVTLPRGPTPGGAGVAGAPSGERTRLEEALAANGGSLERTYRALGLSSRYVLRRLMAKHGLTR